MPGTTVQYRSISFLFNPFQVILSRIVRWVEARAPKTVLEQIRRPGHNVDLMLQKKNTWLFMAISERSKVRAAQAHFQKVEHMDGTKKTIWSWPVSPRPHPHCSPPLFSSFASSHMCASLELSDVVTCCYVHNTVFHYNSSQRHFAIFFSIAKNKHTIPVNTCSAWARNCSFAAAQANRVVMIAPSICCHLQQSRKVFMPPTL